jgi:hypothetical protein
VRCRIRGSYGEPRGTTDRDLTSTALCAAGRVDAWLAADRPAVDAVHNKRDIDFFGCQLRDTVAQAPRDKEFAIWLHITTPYMPITSEGKEPDLEPFLTQIEEAVTRAVRKAHRPNGADRRSQKDIVLDNLDDVIAQVSGEKGYRFNERQIFYQLRPIVQDEIGEELKIGNFKKIIDDYKEEHGETPLMYREPRASITHPHHNETITLGTLRAQEGSKARGRVCARP